MTDKEQAIQDALQAILKARTPKPVNGPQLPPGDIDLPVDPDLLDPEQSNQPESQNDNIDIDDPDNLLKSKQQNQNQDQKSDQQNQNQDQKSDQQNQNQSEQDKTRGQEAEDKHHQISDEFAAAWNEIIDRYDNEEVTDAQLRTLILQIKAGTITEL